MEEKKVCFICDNHENPYLDEMPATNAAGQNFIVISWIGKNTTDSAHHECWWMENQ